MNKLNKFNKIKPSFILLLTMLIAGSTLLTACSKPSKSTVITADAPADTLSEKKVPEKTVLGTIKVQGGDKLERDIIPQLCQVYSLTEQKVKDTLAAAGSSTLIKPELKDFRRMEGIILPGEYTIYEGSTLEEKVSTWVSESEKRYNKLLAHNTSLNKLTAYEKLTLASIVEAECLNNTHQKEVATVFLNRLEAGAKLQSCVTAEYALGYQRPYLTTEDVSKESDYNTYYVKGLPIGPICAVSNDSLEAAIQKKMDSKIYYFYYDYILNDIFFFDDYSRFKKEGSVSRKLFEDKFTLDKRAKINKQELYH